MRRGWAGLGWAGLGCDFVYAFAPRGGKTLEAATADRGREVATALAQRVGTSMALGAQGVEDEATRKKEIDRIAAELLRKGERGLWDL